MFPTPTQGITLRPFRSNRSSRSNALLFSLTSYFSSLFNQTALTSIHPSSHISYKSVPNISSCSSSQFHHSLSDLIHFFTMGRKKTITRLGAAPSPQSNTANIPFPQIPQNDQYQNTLQQMLVSTNHTNRIDALNTISTLFKSNTVSSITQNNLYHQVVELMGDKMMNVALAATSLLRNAVQICDTSLLNFFIAHKLHYACYTLLQHLFPLFINFTNNVVIAKGHGLYWYNPNYLSMVRILNHLVKIISSLFEINDGLAVEFNTLLSQSELEQQQAVQGAPVDPSTAPKINMLSFFFQLLGVKLDTIQPHIVPTIHTPFITQLQIDIYHLLRVLSHENITMTQRFLGEPAIIQHFLQTPLNLLAHHNQIASLAQDSPNASDSTYTYQYCASIALSNLHTEYQKVITQSKKTSALATTFVLHSVPHSNIELAMSIAVIIANMLEQVNVQPASFLSNEHQIKTIQSLYATFTTVLEIAMRRIDINHELQTYAASLEQVRVILLDISQGHLGRLEQYNLASAMSDAAAPSPVAQQQAIRNQFKALNVNNFNDPAHQQAMLVSSLQQLSVQMDGQGGVNLQHLDSLAEPMDEDPNTSPSPAPNSPNDVVNDEEQPQPFSNDEFPLHQLWNDAIQVHNNILIQYYNIKTLIGDCLAMVLTDHVIVDDDDSPQAQQNKQQKQTAQLQLFYNQVAKVLTPANAISLLNHAYCHFPLTPRNPAITTFPSYFPLPLLDALHNLFNTDNIDYVTHASHLNYQNTLLRLTSLQALLLLLQFHLHQNTLISTLSPQLSTIHSSLLHLVAAASISNSLPSQTQPLKQIQDHFAALSTLDTSGDAAIAQQTAAVAQVVNTLSLTSIDEAVLIVQNLTTLIGSAELCTINQSLWSSPSLKNRMGNVAPLKDKVHVTEKLTQNDINQIITELSADQQVVTLYVPEQFALQLHNFLGYILTAQHLTQKNLVNTTTQNQRLFQTSPQVEFQHIALEYISTMAQHYPLFGPVLPKLVNHCTSLITQFLTLKSTQFNCHLLFQFINLIIDVFSEDDRYIATYVENKLTSSLSSLSKIHSEYLSWLKQTKLTLKPKQTGTRAGAKKVVGAVNTTSLTPQKQQQLIKLQEELEITAEANSNLVAFIQYKKGFKL